jgi:hypothetical protein
VQHGLLENRLFRSFFIGMNPLETGPVSFEPWFWPFFAEDRRELNSCIFLFLESHRRCLFGLCLPRLFVLLLISSPVVDLLTKQKRSQKA